MPIWVNVCVWEPLHTLKRVEDRDAAVKSGLVAQIIAQSGGTKNGQPVDGAALVKALDQAQLLTIREDGDDLVCAECGALVEKFVSADGVVSRAEAVRDVVERFDEAIERTREARG